jgi:predicted transcriptional regulator
MTTNPIWHIRKHVFGLSQVEFAVIAGVAQPTVSKWEAGALSPSSDEMVRIRDAARDRELAWRDSWFFEPVNPVQ